MKRTVHPQKKSSLVKHFLFSWCCLFSVLMASGCVTPLYYSDKLSVPIITDSTRTIIEFNSGVELLTKSKWIMKLEATHAPIKPFFLSVNLKALKAFHRDPVYINGGASAGLFAHVRTVDKVDSLTAQLQILFGYDQGRDIGTFKHPPIIGKREIDHRFLELDVESKPTIPVFMIRRHVQANFFLPLNRFSHIIFSYRIAWYSNSRFSIPYDDNIYDEREIYRNGSGATLFEPTITYSAGGSDDVRFLIQVGKVSTSKEESFAVSPIFLVYGVQIGL